MVRKAKKVPHPQDRLVERGLVPLQKRRDALAEALANPMDLRTPEELSEDYGVGLPELRSLQADPRWMAPVTAKFQRALGGVQVLILKKILRQVDDGNMSAARLALQALSGDLGNGVKVNVLNVGATRIDDALGKMGDEELDREIRRLLKQVDPDDLVMKGEEVFPVGEVEVVADESD